MVGNFINLLFFSFPGISGHFRLRILIMRIGKFIEPDSEVWNGVIFQIGLWGHASHFCVRYVCVCVSLCAVAILAQAIGAQCRPPSVWDQPVVAHHPHRP